jgi:cysteine dioxygenase type I
MAHPLRTSVEDFVEGLKSFEEGLITQEEVRRYAEATRLSADALKPYTYFRDDIYTRNLIYRDKLFEVMAICWKLGQKTAVHTHNGQLGWMTVAQGDVSVHNYKYVSCNCPEHQNVVGIDCLAGASRIQLDRLDTLVAAPKSPVYCVDKLQSIHQIENGDKAKAGCVSLHIYSLPIDSCVAFDLPNQRCYRRTFTYYSQYGKVELEVDQPLPAGSNYAY